LTRYKTLSQSFDIGDFIAPDILSVVDATVRAAADDILERGGLVEDIDRIIDLRAAAPYISDASLGGAVPSMNPDEFMPYERPKAPVMTGFDEIAAAAILKVSYTQEEPDFETETMTEEMDEDTVTAGADTLEVDVKIPDLGRIEKTAAMIEEDMIVEMPELSRYNANLLKVKLDTLRFDREFMMKLRFTIIIAAIAVVNIFLIYYLLTH